MNQYCAVCDVRDYHKGKFCPCCYIQPKNGFSGFTEKDFDNLEWDETSRQQMNEQLTMYSHKKSLYLLNTQKKMLLRLFQLGL